MGDETRDEAHRPLAADRALGEVGGRDGREVGDVGEVCEVGVVPGLVEARGASDGGGARAARPGVAAHRVFRRGERAHVERGVVAPARRAVHLHTEGARGDAVEVVVGGEVLLVVVEVVVEAGPARPLRGPAPEGATALQ